MYLPSFNDHFIHFILPKVVTCDHYKIDVHMKNSWITNFTSWSFDL